MNRRWNRVCGPALREHRRHLLDIERVAFCRLLDARASLGIERPFLADLVEQSICLFIGERRKHDSGDVRRRQPALPFLE